VFTSVHPGGWWDTRSSSDLWISELNGTNQVTFTSNYTIGQFNNNYADINNQNDTIPVFWQAFGDSSLLFLGVKEFKQNEIISIYPNPSSNFINIKSLKENYIIKQVRIYILLGKKQLCKKQMIELIFQIWQKERILYKLNLLTGFQ